MLGIPAVSLYQPIPGIIGKVPRRGFDKRREEKFNVAGVPCLPISTAVTMFVLTPQAM